MNLSQLGYLAREALGMMRRYRGITVVSVVIMALSLLMLAVFLLLTDNMFLFLDRAREDMAVYLYLEDNLPQQAVESLHRRILSLPEVEEVVYVSKQQALEELKEQLGGDEELVEALDTNPLPASFRVKLKKRYREKGPVENFARTASAWEGVEEVRFGREFIERFAALTRAFLLVDTGVGLIVVLSAIFIIANTVRLTVVGRRRTIEILKLVGATNGFIATPFLLEGAIQGTMAALLALGMLAPLYLGARRIVPDLAFLSPGKAILFVGLCLLVGALASLAALRRYLRV